MQPTDPFDKHPAVLEALQNRADTLVRLAEEAGDHEVVTDQAFRPAAASWDGVAAEELRRAPVEVRNQAHEVASQVAWAAVPLLTWAERVREFNQKVDMLLERYAAVPAEVEQYIQQRYPGPAEMWPLADLDNERELRRAELIAGLKREWHDAYQLHIDEGEREVCAMLKQGPTWENLATARELGGLPDRPMAEFLIAGWDKQAALAEADRITGLIAGGPHSAPTLAELERLADILSEYGEDEEFAYLFLTGLGQAELLELAAATAALVGEDSDPAWQAAVGAVQAGLAAVLATATTRRGTGTGTEFAPYQPGEFELDRQWVLELALAGRELMAIDRLSGPLEIYGYQALGVLLSHGGFDDWFLSLVGADLIDFEQEHGSSELWSAIREQPGMEGVRLNWLHGPGLEHPAGFDPMVGLMQALADSPEATRAVLTSVSRLEEVPLYASDPDGEMVEVWRLPRLDYLLTDREWPLDVVVDPANAHLDLHGEPRPGLVAFGRALDAATRIDPDERAYWIVESLIRETAIDEQAAGLPNGQPDGNWTKPFSEVDLIHPELRPFLGNIADYYIQDLYWALSELPAGPSADVPYDQRLNLENIDKTHLRMFLAELGKDAYARSTVAAAQMDYTVELYEHYMKEWDVSTPPPPGIGAATGRSTDVIALLDVGATGQVRAELAAGDVAYNEALRQRFWFAELGSALATGSSSGGKAANHVVLTVLEQWERSLQQDSTRQADLYHGDLKQMTREALADMIHTVTYEHVTSQLSPHEFISRVNPSDVEAVRALLYPEGHPRAGEFIPAPEWGDEQLAAWTKFYSADANVGIDELIADVQREYDLSFASRGDDVRADR